MSTELTLRLTDEQVRRLDHVAKKEELSRTEAATRLLELALRQIELPSIHFKDFGVGLEPFIVGTRLRVCRIVSLAREYHGDAAKVAAHVNVPKYQIESALAYAAAFPDEIERDIALNERSYEELKSVLPNLKRITVDLKADAPAP